MRFTPFFSIIMLIVILISCTDNKTINSEELLIGTWTLMEVNGEDHKTKEGLQFSPNKQYFLIDSQGKAVPRFIEKIWSIKNDSLILIDYNWEPEFIEKKGTHIYQITEISENTLELHLLNKEKKTIFVYTK
jgi:hypothetical protein